MTGQSSPHDAVFRRVLGEPINAASQLQAVLPTGLTDQLDLTKLTRVPGSFVDANLRWRHSDLLFTAPLAGREATPPARMTLLLLKTAPGNPHLAAELRRWADDLRAVLDQPDGIEDFVALVTYIENVGETPTDELHDLFAKLGPEAEEAYVTTAEMLRAEGEARGRTEGEAHGRAEALVQLLTHRFGPLPPAASERVRTASIDQLATWTTRALTADTLDEALR